MTNKELLILAAKAIELDGRYVEYRYPLITNYKHYGIVGNYIGGIDSLWNPIENDSDALRLAVSLGICIEYTHDQMHVTTFSMKNLGYPNKEVTKYVGNDPYAATRLAITITAAEYGKQL